MIADTLTRGVKMVPAPEGLSAIHQPGTAAVLWDRALPEDVVGWLGALPPEQLPSARIVLQPGAIPEALAEIYATAGLPDTPARDWLTHDIAMLADGFASLMGAPYLRLRLDRVTTNACRKFHIDAVTARLVCTYRGTGTQYGTAARGETPAQIRTTPTGAPLVLRGTRWPESPAARLLHRSPPIEGTGETRLLLVLDPITNPAEAI